MQNIVRLKVEDNQYVLCVGTAPKMVANNFIVLDELMKKFDFKIIYLEHFIIKCRGGEIYKVENSLTGESPIYIKSLRCALLFTIINFHLSKK